jgi:hypothetical protein
MQSEAPSKWRLLRRGLPCLAGLVAVASACYPSGVDSITDLNTVTTVYDTTFQAAGGFQKLSTYSMPGATVANPQNCVIEDLADGGPFPFPAGSPLPTTICSTVQNQLQDLGYTLIDAATAAGATPPDFIVTVSGLLQSYTAYVSYPWYGYWGGYYPFYPWGGWGIYYPWTSFYYSYQVGTLVITMVKPDVDESLPDGGQMDAIWAGALNGVNQAPNNTPQVIGSGIVQAFNQSPYLGKQ